MHVYSRAIHIGVAHSVTTDSFHQTLRRFICRCGNVKSITSDNGTNRVDGNHELKQEIQHHNKLAVKNWLTEKHIFQI